MCSYQGLCQTKKNILLTWITVGIWIVWEGKKRYFWPMSGFVLNTDLNNCADLQYYWCLLYFSKKKWSNWSRNLLEWMLSEPKLSLCPWQVFFVCFYKQVLQFLWRITLIWSQNHYNIYTCKISDAGGTIICPQMSRLSSTSLIAGFTFLMVISAFAVFYSLGTLIGEKREKKNKKKKTEFASS